MPSSKRKIISWIPQIFAAIILGQTLFFKFSAAPESVLIFEQLDMEPHGRYIIGVLELIACILLLIPYSVVYGALLGAAIMTGALIGHFTRLGWEGDRFSLGMLALMVLLSCLLVLRLRFDELPMIKAVLKEKPRDP